MSAGQKLTGAAAKKQRTEAGEEPPATETSKSPEELLKQQEKEKENAAMKAAETRYNEVVSNGNKYLGVVSRILSSVEEIQLRLARKPNFASAVEKLLSETEKIQKNVDKVKASIIKSKLDLESLPKITPEILDARKADLEKEVKHLEEKYNIYKTDTYTDYKRLSGT